MIKLGNSSTFWELMFGCQNIQAKAIGCLELLTLPTLHGGFLGDRCLHGSQENPTSKKLSIFWFQKSNIFDF